jgi:hypothetical protein
MTGALAAVRDAADVIRADFFLGHMAARVRGGGNVEAVVSDFQQAVSSVGPQDIARAEMKAVKNSRDQFQAKNADLIKQVNYWRKRAEKAEKTK